MRVSEPETAPRHVVPVYGIRIVSPSRTAALVSETLHAATPGPVAPAVAMVGASFPLSCAHADPETLRLPPHCAVKSPDIVVAVCWVICQSKLPHVLPTGADGELDRQTPMYDGRPDAVGARPLC